MSFVPATSNSDMWLTVGAMVAGTIGLQLWVSKQESDPGQIVAECADGTVIGLWHDRVRRRPGRSDEQKTKFAQVWTDGKPPDPNTLRSLAFNELKPGELSVARVRRGAGAEDPWMLEGLNQGRDMTWISWGFEREDLARATLEALDRRIVRAPRDANGRPLTVTEADLDAVQEREQIEAAQTTEEEGARF
jgi:hypothetical protein